MSGVTLAHAIAANRFGFGAKPSELSAIGSDPKAWLKAQTAPGAGSMISTSLPSTQEFLEHIWGGVQSTAMASVSGLDSANLFDYEVRVRTRFAQSTDASFRERLVHFWSNHFTVSNRGELGSTVPAFEREVIRPNVMGKFEDMLIASAQHPVMLYYLENDGSTGPHSPNGLIHGSDINENLAREILELHTMGWEGGYTQADVVAFSNVITGWTFSARDRGERPYGRFFFEPMMHEPGPQTVVGKTYSQSGVDQGIAVLRDLAQHPSTIHRTCTKLATHFHSDTPPAALVDRLKSAWTSSGGDLSVISKALVDAPEMWTGGQGKVKSGNDFWISVLRSVHPHWPDEWRISWAYILLGQLPFTMNSPAGWPDTASAWGAPGMVRQRIMTSASLSEALQPQISSDIPTFAERILGPFLSDLTRQKVASAPNRWDALTILFMSPEFQRR